MAETVGVKVNLIAPRTAKILWSFGRSECNRVKTKLLDNSDNFFQVRKWMDDA